MAYSSFEGPGSVVDALWWLILVAILGGGFVLMAAAAWFANRKR
jgi:hypothetical protein